MDVGREPDAAKPRSMVIATDALVPAEVVRRVADEPRRAVGPRDRSRLVDARRVSASALRPAQAVGRGGVGVDVAAVGVRAVVVLAAGHVEDPARELALDRMRRRARAVVGLDPRRRRSAAASRVRRRCSVGVADGVGRTRHRRERERRGLPREFARTTRASALARAPRPRTRCRRRCPRPSKRLTALRMRASLHGSAPRAGVVPTMCLTRIGVHWQTDRTHASRTCARTSYLLGLLLT